MQKPQSDIVFTSKIWITHFSQSGPYSWRYVKKHEKKWAKYSSELVVVIKQYQKMALTPNSDYHIRGQYPN